MPAPVRLDGGASQRIPLAGTDPRLPGVYLAVEVRPQSTAGPAGSRGGAGLVNAQDEPPANKDTAWLFQPGFCRQRGAPGPRLGTVAVEPAER